MYELPTARTIRPPDRAAAAGNDSPDGHGKPANAGSNRAGRSLGPFSLGVRGAGLLFLSGRVAQDPATGRLIDGDVARQTHQILGNITTALETVGKPLGDVLRVGVYLTDISDFAVMSQAYSEHFAEPYPARTAIGVAALPLGAAVEMDVVVG